MHCIFSPLQEELDTNPLPPEAKEFEKIPKAQCTTCEKMVPLQILPAHIKECKIDLFELSYVTEEVCQSFVFQSISQLLMLMIFCATL